MLIMNNKEQKLFLDNYIKFVAILPQEQHQTLKHLKNKILEEYVRRIDKSKKKTETIKKELIEIKNNI